MWACTKFRTMRFCWWATWQWRSHQNTHKTFPSKSFSCKWFLRFYFWAVIWSYIVDLFAALHELASASARTLLKLASSVHALLKPYGDTLSGLKFATYYRALTWSTHKFILATWNVLSNETCGIKINDLRCLNRVLRARAPMMRALVMCVR